MKQLYKTLNKNQLSTTFILSGLLHLTGFYFLSSLSYLPDKKAELVPVKIKVVVKKENMPRKKITPKKVLPGATANENSDIKVSQLKMQPESSISLKKRSAVSARSAHLTASNFTSFSPTKLRKDPSQTTSKRSNLPIRAKDTPILTAVDFTESTTPATLHVQTINLKSSSSIVLQKQEPTKTENYNNNYANNPMIVSNNFIPNELGKKPNPLHARLPSKLLASVNLTHIPSRLAIQKISRLHFYAKPKARMASVQNGFSEEYFGVSRIHPDLTPKSIKNEQAPALELGRLRKGFVKQIRSNIIKAKYYPRIARKRGFEGKPIVAFSLGGKGELINLLLDLPSDHKVLNDAALETIRRGAPYPPIPDQLKEKLINFKLPILYILGKH